MTNIYENYLNLEEYLKDSADKVCNFSIKNCKHGIMAKDCDCFQKRTLQCDQQ